MLNGARTIFGIEDSFKKSVKTAAEFYLKTMEMKIMSTLLILYIQSKIFLQKRNEIFIWIQPILLTPKMQLR